MVAFCLQIEEHELKDGSCHGISPSSLHPSPRGEPLPLRAETHRATHLVKFPLFFHHKYTLL